ncbi:MAG: response regulator [Spirochaetia bacterium]|nr:response regulator [Spirochaetia bacterium]
MPDPGAAVPVRVLLVEDDDDHAELMRFAFDEAGGFDLDRSSGVAAARRLIDAGTFALVVSDYRLPDGEGLSLIDRDGEGEVRFPVLILTSQGSETVAADAIKRGALDYLVKSPETFARLPEYARIALRAWGAERERTEARRRLEASLAEKEVLLREVHHRVKNNFQVVSSLLSLQAAHHGDGPVREALAVSEQRIRSMALIHEKLYDAGDFTGIDFAEYAESMAARAALAHDAGGRGIAVRTRLERARLPLDQAVPLGLALNELLSNAFAHAFGPGTGGAIELVLAAGDDAFRLEVADDGAGLPRGVDGRDADTLGFQLIEVLTRQAGAAYSVESSPGAGTRVVITLPRGVSAANGPHGPRQA